MVNGNFLLEPTEPTPGETLAKLGTAIDELEEKLVERVVGADTLEEVELWLEVGRAFHGLDREERETLRFFDNVQGRPDKADDPWKKVYDTRILLREMATDHLPWPAGLEETYLVNGETGFASGHFAFGGDIMFDGEMIVGGEVTFVVMDGDDGFLPKNEILVGISTKGLSVRYMLELLKAVLSDSEAPKRYDIASLHIEDSPFSTEELLAFVSGFKMEYERLLSLPVPELIDLVMSFRESENDG